MGGGVLFMVTGSCLGGSFAHFAPEHSESGRNRDLKKEGGGESSLLDVS